MLICFRKQLRKLVSYQGVWIRHKLMWMEPLPQKGLNFNATLTLKIGAQYKLLKSQLCLLQLKSLLSLRTALSPAPLHLRQPISSAPFGQSRVPSHRQDAVIHSPGWHRNSLLRHPVIPQARESQFKKLSTQIFQRNTNFWWNKKVSH